MPEDKPEDEPAKEPATPAAQAEADPKPETAKAEPESAKAKPKADSPKKAGAASKGKRAPAKPEPEPAKAKPEPAKARAPGEKLEPKPAKFDPKPVNVGGESILERILPHVKKIAIALGIVVMIVMVAVVVVWFKERKALKATEKVSAVIDVYDRPVRPPNVPADPRTPSYANEAERANAVLDSIVKEGAEKLGAFRGAALVEAGLYDDAIAEYRRVQGEPGLDGVLAREGLGIALEAKALAEKDPAARQKNLEDALAAFVAMQPDDKGPRRAYALYHQGRLQTTLGKRADAKAAFQKAKELGKDTDLPDLIDERLVTLGGS